MDSRNFTVVCRASIQRAFKKTHPGLPATRVKKEGKLGLLMRTILITLLIGLGFFSCKDDPNAELAGIVFEWQEREVIFPREDCIT